MSTKCVFPAMQVTKTKMGVLCMKTENVVRVAYVFGVLEGQMELLVDKLNADFPSSEEEFAYFKKISDEWEANNQGTIEQYSEKVILKDYADPANNGWTTALELKRAEFFCTKYVEALSEIAEMCRQGKSLDEIGKLASLYAAFEGV